MKVQLAFKTKDMKKGKIKTKDFSFIKEAEQWYETFVEEVAICAYLRRFDGWEWQHYKTLKKEESV